MTEEAETYKVVLYARVSTDDKGQTTETQIRAMKEYCGRNNFVIADNGKAIYEDTQTATNDMRPGFREMKGRISERDIDFVVARNQDRISREPVDYQNFINFAKQYRVRLRFVDNDAKPETTDGVILDSVQAGLAKADNMKRSSTTKAGMQTAKLNGIHCGRRIMFCWSDEVMQNSSRIQTEGEHRTVIQSVETIMDFARQGMSVSKTADTIGVSRMTLKRALRSKGIEEQYEGLRSICCTKGIMHKRVKRNGDNVLKREGTE